MFFMFTAIYFSQFVCSSSGSFMLTVQLPDDGHKNRLKHAVVNSKNIVYYSYLC